VYLTGAPTGSAASGSASYYQQTGGRHENVYPAVADMTYSYLPNTHHQHYDNALYYTIAEDPSGKDCTDAGLMLNICA
jgi:hypothetical protein